MSPVKLIRSPSLSLVGRDITVAVAWPYSSPICLAMGAILIAFAGWSASTGNQQPDADVMPIGITFLAAGFGLWIMVRHQHRRSDVEIADKDV